MEHENKQILFQWTNPSYSHCGVCSKQLLVVFLPWIIAIFINIVIKQVPSGIIFNSKLVKPPFTLQKLFSRTTLL